MFVPDILHEFELGVWKAIFVHLLRILYAEGKDRIQILNERCVLIFPLLVARNSNMIALLVMTAASPSFRKVPTFGRSTIRRFSRNVSGLKQMAGRDLEDILQVHDTVIDSVYFGKY